MYWLLRYLRERDNLRKIDHLNDSELYNLRTLEVSRRRILWYTGVSNGEGDEISKQAEQYRRSTEFQVCNLHDIEYLRTSNAY